MKHTKLLHSVQTVTILSFGLISSGNIVKAATYRDLNGVDQPINYIASYGGGPHTYFGPNLEPGVNLENANLRFADLHFANLSDADLTNADLTNAYLNGAHLTAATLYNADLSAANLYNAFLNGANLTIATLYNADLRFANLSDANLYGAILYDARLSNADLTSANLSAAELSGVSSGWIIGTPMALPNFWQITNGYLIGPGANLTLADLTGADLSNAVLVGVNLTNANLTGADLTNVIWGTGSLGYVLSAQLASEYTLEEIADLRPGSSMIEIINGEALLNFKVQESDNLIDWTDTAETSTVTIPAPDPGKKFFRFAGPQ